MMDTKAIFRLCKRKKLKPAEKDILVNTGDEIKNGDGETVFHNYMKHDGLDWELMERMLETHDIGNINRKGYTIFQSCLQYCHLSPEDLYAKVDWLIDHGCPLGSEKKDLTKFILYDHLLGEYDTPYKISDRYQELIQQLLEMGELKTDLRENQYRMINPAPHCTSLEMLKWFEENFQFEYQPRDGKYDLCWPCNEIKNYLCQKNTGYLEKMIQRGGFLNQCIYDHVYFILLERYGQGMIDEDSWTEQWNKFLYTYGFKEEPPTSSRIGVRKVAPFSINAKTIRMFIYGFKKGWIKNYPLEEGLEKIGMSQEEYQAFPPETCLDYINLTL